MIGLKFFTFSVGDHRLSTLARAILSSSDLARVGPLLRDHVVTSSRSSTAIAGENISSSRSLASAPLVHAMSCC